MNTLWQPLQQWVWRLFFSLRWNMNLAEQVYQAVKPFPFSDLSAHKKRPVLILSQAFKRIQESVCGYLECPSAAAEQAERLVGDFGIVGR